MLHRKHASFPSRAALQQTTCAREMDEVCQESVRDELELLYQGCHPTTLGQATCK